MDIQDILYALKVESRAYRTEQDSNGYFRVPVVGGLICDGFQMMRFVQWENIDTAYDAFRSRDINIASIATDS